MPEERRNGSIVVACERCIVFAQLPSRFSDICLSMQRDEAEDKGKRGGERAAGKGEGRIVSLRSGKVKCDFAAFYHFATRIHSPLLTTESVVCGGVACAIRQSSAVLTRWS
jgi:hypothetical protein